jgi:hypothetical protein
MYVYNFETKKIWKKPVEVEMNSTVFGQKVFHSYNSIKCANELKFALLLTRLCCSMIFKIIITKNISNSSYL